MIRQEDIKKIIKDRKNKIANEIELDPLTFLPSRQMEYIDLNLDRGPLMFEFISGRKNLNCEIAFSVSGAFLLEDPSKRTSVNIINIFDLVELAACLELFVELKKTNTFFEDYTFSIKNAEKDDVFEIIFLSDNQQLLNRKYLALKFRLNKKEPEEQENDYIEFKEITSLDNILIFTSSIKDFLRKMCTTKKTNFSITEETNLLNTLQYNNQILAQTQSYAGNFYSLEDCYFDLDRENDFSIEEWRGISNSDENIRYILVEAPVELVAQTYYRLKSMNVWLPNTYGNKIVIQPNSILVFRFRGHKWSVIYEPSNVYSGEIIPTEEDALKISELLNTAAIFYVNSDTSGYIAYDFYDKGVLLERLDYQEYSEIKFESQLRVLDPKDIYGYDLTYNFLSDRGAYIPCLYEENFFIPEKERILQMNKLLPNEMERMDYLAKKFDKSNEIFSPTVMSQGTI